MDEAPEGGREEAVRVKEQSILRLGEVLAKHDFAEGEFLVFLGLVSRARLLACGTIMSSLDHRPR